jgi:hypothetical protein
MTATSVTMYETTASGFALMDFSGTGAVTTEEYTADPTPSDGDWRNTVVARLAELERLAPSWDSEGALPTTRRHANRAFAFIARLMALGDVPVPEIIPLSDGGVQVEWHLEHGGRVDFVSDEESEPVVLVEIAGGLSEYPARSVDLAAIRAQLTGEANIT